uniref:HAT C-terminal dimerisation domain-containing protein n=1 Tax=Lutzomyia longipalpis TaxID=7200 RepID=A0A1B0CWP6_LUTLO
MVVASVHTSGGTKALVEAYDFNEKPETTANVFEVVKDAISKAEVMYKTRVYAVETDNASNMVGLAEEYKKPDKAAFLKSKGYPVVKLPNKTRWNTQRDGLKSFLLSRSVCIEGEIKYGISNSSIIHTLQDDELKEDAEDLLKDLNPISALINKAQSDYCDLADATIQWLELEHKVGERYKQLVRARVAKAISVYGLVAVALHPVYDSSILSPEHMTMAESFLHDHLGISALEDYYDFKARVNVFALADENTFSNPLDFWRHYKRFTPELANLAIRIMKIPAATAGIERLFSQWSIVHSRLRNRLQFSKSKKLALIYYNSSMQNDRIYDIDEDGNDENDDGNDEYGDGNDQNRGGHDENDDGNDDNIDGDDENVDDNNDDEIYDNYDEYYETDENGENDDIDDSMDDDIDYSNNIQVIDGSVIHRNDDGSDVRMEEMGVDEAEEEYQWTDERIRNAARMVTGEDTSMGIRDEYDDDDLIEYDPNYNFEAG